MGSLWRPVLRCWARRRASPAVRAACEVGDRSAAPPPLVITATGITGCWLACLFYVAGWQTSGPNVPIQLHLPELVCAAPCDMEATIVIQKHPDNRSASVVWGYGDSREWQLSPRTQQVTFTVSIGKFEKGEHVVYAVLLREKDGRRETFEASQRISVR